ncbi:MAG: hypothetical protein NT135_02330, partial [Candidatus Berkelbacteria bacterium]|nr:hypothetical protein [Candidatus Berkelbacteria bacterium]
MGTQRVKEYQEPEEKKSLDDVRDKEETKAEKSEKVFRSKPKRVRGKKYLELRSLVQDNKFYPAGEAFDLVKKASFTKFDPSVEVHIKLKLKAGQTVRGMVNLPHGAGKEPKVAIFNENMLSEIQKSKLDFDI